MFQIELNDKFRASHRIRLNGQWEELHWHNWQVRVFFSRKRLDKNSIVMDFDEGRKILRNLLNEIENKELNRIEQIGKNPTAEMIARYLYDKINSITRERFRDVELDAVGICETEGCWAWYKI